MVGSPSIVDEINGKLHPLTLRDLAEIENTMRQEPLRMALSLRGVSEQDRALLVSEATKQANNISFVNPGSLLGTVRIAALVLSLSLKGAMTIDDIVAKIPSDKLFQLVASVWKLNGVEAGPGNG